MDAPPTSPPLAIPALDQGALALAVSDAVREAMPEIDAEVKNLAGKYYIAYAILRPFLAVALNAAGIKLLSKWASAPTPNP
jgi:hypothetical protein